MAKRTVIWTKVSENQIKEILQYFVQRNKSTQYSRKLYSKFKSELRTAAKNPYLGLQTKIDQIRGLIIEDYILFYEILEDKIVVLKVWDCRQNPDNMIISR